MWFVVEETPYHRNEFVIKPSKKLYEKIPYIEGSYCVYPARLCGFTYGDWCRYCRDKFDANLYGNSKYIIPAFPSKENAETLVKFLNKRMNEVLKGVN